MYDREWPGDMVTLTLAAIVQGHGSRTCTTRTMDAVMIRITDECVATVVVHWQSQVDRK